MSPTPVGRRINPEVGPPFDMESWKILAKESSELLVVDTADFRWLPSGTNRSPGSWPWLAEKTSCAVCFALSGGSRSGAERFWVALRGNPDRGSLGASTLCIVQIRP